MLSGKFGGRRAVEPSPGRCRREADREEIRGWLPTELSDLPAYMVHGPAAAFRPGRKGVFDDPFLRAIAYHTIGHPDLDQLGRAVYVADFLELEIVIRPKDRSKGKK